MPATPTWIRAASTRDLDRERPVTVRHDGKQIALFALPAGVFAIDRRCPHEGYPLTQGTVRGRELTCDWHNWKFRLDDGACTFGGEDVRTYPVDVRGDAVYVDVADPEREEIEPRLFADLREALGRRDTGRIARGVVRLEDIGTPVAEVVAQGVAFGAGRMEYGWNHSLATLADCLRLADGARVSPAALPVVQGLSVVADNEAYRPIRSRPDPVDPVATYGSIADALAAYPVLVEEEDAAGAEALLRGLIAAGAAPDAIRRAHLTAVTDHFLSYGHPLIYTQKAFDLLDAIGWEHADTVLSPLAPNAVLSTRYDRLPYMRSFRRAWEADNLDLAAVAAGRDAAGGWDPGVVRRALLDGSAADAYRAIAGALRGGAPVAALIDVTADAAAVRFLRFDLDHETDDTNDLNWLDVTHTLTTIHALRWAWSVAPGPAVLRGLFHAAWFVNWARRVDGAPATVRPRQHADPDAVDAAIEGRDPEAAAALTAGWDGPDAMLEGVLARRGAADTAVSPIMVAHTVKTTRAAIEESRVLGRRGPLVATARFLASPRRERFVLRSVNEARDLVAGRAKGDGA